MKTLKESQAQTEGVCKDHQCAKERKALLKKTSSLNTLDPYLDVTGVLRVGGWIMKANPTDSLKNPVILPKTGHNSELIIRHIHKKTHHSGRGVTLNFAQMATGLLIVTQQLDASSQGASDVAI